ncbi:hypothetical protein ACLKA7_012033 [Drosophila subpalustris]
MDTALAFLHRPKPNVMAERHKPFTFHPRTFTRLPKSAIAYGLLTDTEVPSCSVSAFGTNNFRRQREERDEDEDEADEMPRHLVSSCITSLSSPSVRLQILCNT